MPNPFSRALLNKRFHIQKIRVMEKAVRRFTSAEKALFYFFAALFTLSSLILIFKVNNSFLIDMPVEGGTVTEGIVGNPRFINPVLAISEADKSLVSLVYSGLIKVGDNGDLVNDLAESLEVSPDGLTYTAKIRSDATFHNRVHVTADDVIFTFQKIQDPDIKSPLFGEFTGVTISKVNDDTISFTLKSPYAPFINNLTIGILPKHVWSSVTDDEFSFSQWNVLPIGSGPYRVDSVERDSGGIPNFYNLVPFEEAIGSKAFIEHLVFKFYPSGNDLLDAYDSGDIQSLSGISPKDASLLEEDGARVISAPLPRIFGVFFNQSANEVLLDKTVRRALDIAAPKEKIVEEILGGYGTVINSPLPPGLVVLDNASSTVASTTNSVINRLELASTTLADAGWERNSETGVLEKKSKAGTIELSFTLSTSDNPELKAVAEMLKASWQELGAQVDISIYEPGDLNQNVIRPRRYQALLFGEVVGRDADVYPFWHSSERNDPGLNIALYVSSEVDELLEDIRTESDKDIRKELYESFNANIREDVPAVFLYSPNLIYVVPEDIQGISLSKLGTTQDRFADVRDWYVETSSVWNIFTKDSPQITPQN
ncbi:MAG: ABC transporter substrate-binding protein [Minisyncoccota bacterium]